MFHIPGSTSRKIEKEVENEIVKEITALLGKDMVTYVPSTTVNHATIEFMEYTIIVQVRFDDKATTTLLRIYQNGCSYITTISYNEFNKKEAEELFLLLYNNSLGNKTN